MWALKVLRCDSKRHLLTSKFQFDTHLIADLDRREGTLLHFLNRRDCEKQSEKKNRAKQSNQLKRGFPPFHDCSSSIQRWLARRDKFQDCRRDESIWRK